MDNLTIPHWTIREFKPTCRENSDILWRKTRAAGKGAMVVESEIKLKKRKEKDRAGENNESIIYQEQREKRA